MGKKRYNENEGLPSFSDMEGPAEVGGGSEPAAADGLPSFSDMGEPSKLDDIVTESAEPLPKEKIDLVLPPLKKTDGGLSMPVPQIEKFQPSPEAIQLGLDADLSRSYESAQKRYADLDSQLANTPKTAGKAPMSDQNREKLKRLKQELSVASKESAKAVDEVDPVAQRIISNLDLNEFTMTDMNGMTVADPRKVDEFAAQAAEDKGLPNDGFFKQYLHNKMIGEVEGDIIRPRVEKEFNKQYYLKY